MLRGRSIIVVAGLAVLQGVCLSGEIQRSGGEAGGYWSPRNPPRAEYRIICSMDPGAGTMEGTEVLLLKNTTTGPIRRLAMKWPTVGKQTLEITANGRVVSFEQGIGSQPILFSLHEAAQVGRSIKLEVKFSIVIPKQGQVPERITMTDWYPRLWWGYDSHDNYEVTLTVPEGYTVGTSGVYDSRTKTYRIEGAKSFGVFLGRDHKVFEAKSGDVAVRCLYRPGSEKCAELLATTAADVISFYSTLYEFYPYRSLTIVPGGDQPMGGYPIATGLVAIHGMDRMKEESEMHWKWITAHEIGHQYWGEWVIERDEPGWLWIGMGIYADREYSRARGLGPDKYEAFKNRYIGGAQKGHDTTLRRSMEKRTGFGFDFNNVAIHGKGYSVISALDCVLGKEVFGKIQRRCLKEYGGRRLGADGFRAVCEDQSEQDLGWFFEQWIDSNRTLWYEIAGEESRKTADGYSTKVTVKRVGELRMPMPVEARFSDGTSQRRLTDRLLDTSTLTFESRAGLKEVVLDPDRALAMVNPQTISNAGPLEREIENLPWAGAGERAKTVFEKALKADYTDGGAWFKIAMALYDGKYDEQAQEAFARVEKVSKNSTEVFAAIVWQGHLLDLAGKRDQAVQQYTKALDKNEGQSMRHDQYRMEINREWVEKRLKEPFRRE